MLQGITQDTLERAKAYADLARGWKQKDLNVSFGYVDYDLQSVVDSTFPIYTPLRNTIARVRGAGGTATHWKSIDAINTQFLSMGVSEGNRNATLSTKLTDHSVPYAEIGYEDQESWKAEDATGRLTPDLMTTMTKNLVLGYMQGEERLTLWGNSGNSIHLGTCPTPVASLTAGGSMTAQAWDFYAVALTGEGWRNAHLSTATGGGIPALLTRTNVDGSVDQYGGGSSQLSAVSNSVTTAGGNLSVTLKLPNNAAGFPGAVSGAVAYAWFGGAHSGATSTMYLAAITTVAEVTLTTNPNTSPVLNNPNLGYWYTADHFSSDNSANQLVFDGILPQAIVGGGMYIDQGAQPFTAVGTNAVAEINADLLSFYNTNLIAPTRIIMNATDYSNLTAKITAGTPRTYILDVTKNDQTGLVGGLQAAGYISPYISGRGPIPFVVHPDMPQGTMMYIADELPFRTGPVGNILLYRILREMRLMQWPSLSRRYQFGCYGNEALEVHYPLAFGIRTNIGNG